MTCPTHPAWCWVRPATEDIGLDFWKCNALPVRDCVQTCVDKLGQDGRFYRQYNFTTRQRRWTTATWKPCASEPEPEQNIRTRLAEMAR